MAAAGAELRDTVLVFWPTTLVSYRPVPGTRTVRRTLPSAPRLIRTGPAPALADKPRCVNVNRNGPTDFVLRNCTMANDANGSLPVGVREPHSSPRGATQVAGSVVALVLDFSFLSF
ncbi:hypothetical protein MGAST_15500 [Mycobacterium gastri 'Wayne']|uniref:Uncharacterized protein n=1 Tax=Mycobacterium gastri TaxID=1777 RepID=A0A1X1USZ1_MYCGS|nr:hypothetical protein MGAST_15500 [Mycobacterium gastri 'Wayne']ORV59966.1 hypothetical protein AWC07_19280 [Mycobacterium gastri]